MADRRDEVAAALGARAAALQERLLAKVEANLSGEVLQERSGTLKHSIVSDIEEAGTMVTATIASVGVPYAAIQEYGGHTAPHEIVPVKAKALALAGGFARRVQHPGSAIPARLPFGGALEALKDEIAAGLKSAVLDALGAS